MKIHSKKRIRHGKKKALSKHATQHQHRHRLQNGQKHNKKIRPQLLQKHTKRQLYTNANQLINTQPTVQPLRPPTATQTQIAKRSQRRRRTNRTNRLITMKNRHRRQGSGYFSKKLNKGWTKAKNLFKGVRKSVGKKSENIFKKRAPEVAEDAGALMAAARLKDVSVDAGIHMYKQVKLGNLLKNKKNDFLNYGDRTLPPDKTDANSVDIFVRDDLIANYNAVKTADSNKANILTNEQLNLRDEQFYTKNELAPTTNAGTTTSTEVVYDPYNLGAGGKEEAYQIIQKERDVILNEINKLGIDPKTGNSYYNKQDEYLKQLQDRLSLTEEQKANLNQNPDITTNEELTNALETDLGIIKTQLEAATSTETGKGYDLMDIATTAQNETTATIDKLRTDDNMTVMKDIWKEGHDPYGIGEGGKEEAYSIIQHKINNLKLNEDIYSQNKIKYLEDLQTKLELPQTPTIVSDYQPSDSETLTSALDQDLLTIKTNFDTHLNNNIQKVTDKHETEFETQIEAANKLEDLDVFKFWEVEWWNCNIDFGIPDGINLKNIFEAMGENMTDALKVVITQDASFLTGPVFWNMILYRIGVNTLKSWIFGEYTMRSVSSLNSGLNLLKKNSIRPIVTDNHFELIFIKNQSLLKDDTNTIQFYSADEKLKQDDALEMFMLDPYADISSYFMNDNTGTYSDTTKKKDGEIEDKRQKELRLNTILGKKGKKTMDRVFGYPNVNRLRKSRERKIDTAPTVYVWYAVLCNTAFISRNDKGEKIYCKDLKQYSLCVVLCHKYKNLSNDMANIPKHSYKNLKSMKNPFTESTPAQFAVRDIIRLANFRDLREIQKLGAHHSNTAAILGTHTVDLGLDNKQISNFSLGKMVSCVGGGDIFVRDDFPASNGGQRRHVHLGGKNHQDRMKIVSERKSGDANNTGVEFERIFTKLVNSNMFEIPVEPSKDTNDAFIFTLSLKSDQQNTLAKIYRKDTTLVVKHLFGNYSIIPDNSDDLKNKSLCYDYYTAFINAISSTSQQYKKKARTGRLTTYKALPKNQLYVYDSYFRSNPNNRLRDAVKHTLKQIANVIRAPIYQYTEDKELGRKFKVLRATATLGKTFLGLRPLTASRGIRDDHLTTFWKMQDANSNLQHNLRKMIKHVNDIQDDALIMYKQQNQYHRLGRIHNRLKKTIKNYRNLMLDGRNNWTKKRDDASYNAQDENHNAQLPPGCMPQNYQDLPMVEHPIRPIINDVGTKLCVIQPYVIERTRMYIKQVYTNTGGGTQLPTPFTLSSFDTIITFDTPGSHHSLKINDLVHIDYDSTETFAKNNGFYRVTADGNDPSNNHVKLARTQTSIYCNSTLSYTYNATTDEWKLCVKDEMDMKEYYQYEDDEYGSKQWYKKYDMVKEIYKEKKKNNEPNYFQTKIYINDGSDKATLLLPEENGINYYYWFHTQKALIRSKEDDIYIKLTQRRLLANKEELDGWIDYFLHGAQDSSENNNDKMMWVTNSNSGDDKSKYQDECDGKDVYFYLNKFCTAFGRTPYLTEVCYVAYSCSDTSSSPSFSHIVHIGLWYAHQKKSIQTEADKIRFWKNFDSVYSNTADKVQKDLRKWNISIKWQKSGTNGTSEKNVRCLFGWDYDKDHGVLKTSLPSARTGCYTLLDAAQKSNWENVKSWQQLKEVSGSCETTTHRRYNAKYKILRLNENKFDDNNQTHMDYDDYKKKFKGFTFHNTYQSENQMGYFNYDSDNKPKLLFKPPTVKSDIFPIRNGVFRILKDDHKIGSSQKVNAHDSGIWWFGANGLMHRLKREDFNTQSDKCSVIDEKKNIKTIQMSLLHDRYEPSEMWYDHTVLITQQNEKNNYHLVRFDKTIEKEKVKYYGCVQNDKTVSRDPSDHWEKIVDGVYKWSDISATTSYYLIYSNTSPPQIINLKSITPTPSISNTVSISSDDPFNKTFYDRTKKEFEKEWFHNVLLLPENDAATNNVFYYNYVTGKFLGFNNSSNSDLEWNKTEANCLWKYEKKSNYGVLYYFCGDSGTHTCSRKRVVHSVMDPLMVLGEGNFNSAVSANSTITVSPVDPPYLHCNSDDTGIQKDIVAAVSGIPIDITSIKADFKENRFSFIVNADIAITDLFTLTISNSSAGVYTLTNSPTNSITIRLKPKKSLSDVFKIHTIPEGIQLFDTDTTANKNFYTTLDDVCWILTTVPNVFYAPALNKQINITNEHASNEDIYDNSILPTVWEKRNGPFVTQDDTFRIQLTPPSGQVFPITLGSLSLRSLSTLDNVKKIFDATLTDINVSVVVGTDQLKFTHNSGLEFKLIAMSDRVKKILGFNNTDSNNSTSGGELTSNTNCVLSGSSHYVNLVTGTVQENKPDRPIDWIQIVNANGKITYENGADNGLKTSENPALSTMQQREHVKEVVNATNNSLPIGWDATVETYDLQVKYNQRKAMNWIGYDSATDKWNTLPSDEVDLPPPTPTASAPSTVVALQDVKISAGENVSNGRTPHENIPCSGTGNDLEVSFTMINIQNNEAFVENVRVTNGGTGYTTEKEVVTADNFNKDKNGDAKNQANFTAKVNLGFITPNEPKPDIKRIFTDNTKKFTYTDRDDKSCECPVLSESTVVANGGVIWQRRFSTQYNGYYYYTINDTGTGTPKFSWNKPPTT